MAQQHLNFGLGAGSHTGETVFAGATKIESNFTELYTALSGLPSLANQSYVNTQIQTAIPAVAIDRLYGGTGSAGAAQQVVPTGLITLASGNLTLTQIASNTLLANATGGTAAPTATSLSALMDAALGATRGGVLYRGASGWSYLAPGTAGYVFQTNGSGVDPSWAPVASGSSTTSVTTVGNSGTSQVLTFTPGSKAFDVTLTGNCAFTFAGAATGSEQTIKLWLRGGAGGFTVSFPSIVWRGGSAPTGALAASGLLTISFSTPDGGTTIEGVF